MSEQFKFERPPEPIRKEEVPEKEKTGIEFDPSVVDTAEDRALIEETIGKALKLDPSEGRWRSFSTIAELDPERAKKITTEEDWNNFFQEIKRLDQDLADFFARKRVPTGIHAAPRARIEYITGMARIDRERAKQALQPKELDDLELSLKDAIRKRDPGGVEMWTRDLVPLDPGRVKKIFQERPEAWEIVGKDLEDTRGSVPPHFFELLAQLTKIDPKRTSSFLRKRDWSLALEGLAHYRQEARRGITGPLIKFTAQLKNLTPLFKELFSENR